MKALLKVPRILHQPTCVCVYYCSTYYKAVREAGGNGGQYTLIQIRRSTTESVLSSQMMEKGGLFVGRWRLQALAFWSPTCRGGGRLCV